jgi:WD repeat-containing protein 22
MDYDAFYGAGSDDFRGYIWQIPPVAQLLEEREEISPVDWLSNASETPGLVGAYPIPHPLTRMRVCSHSLFLSR